MNTRTEWDKDLRRQNFKRARDTEAKAKCRGVLSRSLAACLVEHKSESPERQIRSSAGPPEFKRSVETVPAVPAVPIMQTSEL